jgi:hypothetical protein
MAHKNIRNKTIKNSLRRIGIRRIQPDKPESRGAVSSIRDSITSFAIRLSRVSKLYAGKHKIQPEHVKLAAKQFGFPVYGLHKSSAKQQPKPVEITQSA